MKKTEAFFELIRSDIRPFSDLNSGLQSIEIAECLEKRIPVYEL